MEPKKSALVLRGIAGPAAESIENVVRETLRDLDVQLMSVDDPGPAATTATAGVTGAIQKADVIVADVTSPSPNVLYELGYAHALRKPTMLLLSTKAAATIPSDLAGSHLIVYDPDNVSLVRRQVQRFLERQIVRLAY